MKKREQRDTKTSAFFRLAAFATSSSVCRQKNQRPSSIWRRRLSERHEEWGEMCSVQKKKRKHGALEPICTSGGGFFSQRIKLISELIVKKMDCGGDTLSGRQSLLTFLAPSHQLSRSIALSLSFCLSCTITKGCARVLPSCRLPSPTLRGGQVNPSALPSGQVCFFSVYFQFALSGNCCEFKVFWQCTELLLFFFLSFKSNKRVVELLWIYNSLQHSSIDCDGTRMPILQIKPKVNFSSFYFGNFEEVAKHSL